MATETSIFILLWITLGAVAGMLYALRRIFLMEKAILRMEKTILRVERSQMKIEDKKSPAKKSSKKKNKK